MNDILLHAIGEAAYAGIQARLAPCQPADVAYIMLGLERYATTPLSDGRPPEPVTVKKAAEPISHLAQYLATRGLDLRHADSEPFEDYVTRRRPDAAPVADAPEFLSKLGKEGLRIHKGRLRTIIGLVEGEATAHYKISQSSGRRPPVDILEQHTSTQLANAMKNLQTARDRYAFTLPTFFGLDQATALEVRPEHLTYTEEGVPQIFVPASNRCPYDRTVYAYAGWAWISEHHRQVLSRKDKYMLSKEDQPSQFLNTDDVGRMVRQWRAGQEAGAPPMTWTSLRSTYLCFLASTGTIGDGTLREIMGLVREEEAYRFRDAILTAQAQKAPLARWGFGRPGAFGHANLFCTKCQKLTYDPTKPHCPGCHSDLERLPASDAALTILVHQLRDILGRLGFANDQIQSAAIRSPPA